MASPSAAPRPSVPVHRRSRLALARARHRSPLRRRSDRRRAVLVKLQTLALLLAVGLCTVLGMAVYHQDRAHAVAYESRLRPVQALIVGQPYDDGTATVLAQVRWTGSGGTARQDVSQVPKWALVGDRVRIQLDASGAIAAPPASAGDSEGNAVVIALLTLFGAATGVAAVGTFARCRLDRADEAAWAAEWEVVEPLWTRRR
ncbi:hypothetical protein [Streptacidiphilus sp. EB129]|uniref:Rv1733c family protein n=1 Tax=Streptacidiphilus sp. EB129 TaxID=3156262 RepID=UPI00351863A4